MTELTTLQAINAVASDLGDIAKTQRHKQFAYRGIADVLNNVEPLKEKHGLVCLPQVVDHVMDDFTGFKTKQVMTVLTVKFHFFSKWKLDSGYEAIVVGYGVDSSDKGPGKALSYAQKACYQVVFGITDNAVAIDNEASEVEGGEWAGDLTVQQFFHRSREAIQALPEDVRNAYVYRLIELNILRKDRTPQSNLTWNDLEKGEEVLQQAEAHADSIKENNNE